VKAYAVGFYPGDERFDQDKSEGYDRRDKEAKVSWRTLVGRGALTTLGVLLALGLLGGCGGSEKDDGEVPDIPASPEEAGNIAIRVSGTEGVAYSGIYGTITGEPQIVDDTLGGEPTEYEVEVGGGDPSGVTAGFQKTQPGTGALKVAILADGEVVSESTTYAELGTANVDWLSQTGAPADVIPREEIPPEEGEEIPPEEIPPEEKS
jgi:hypothetical protein